MALITWNIYGGFLQNGCRIALFFAHIRRTWGPLLYVYTVMFKRISIVGILLFRRFILSFILYQCLFHGDALFVFLRISFWVGYRAPHGVNSGWCMSTVLLVLLLYYYYYVFNECHRD